MQYSSEEIERFIEAMEADEHLRARVERAILSDRMYELPDRLAELAAAVDRLTETLNRFIEETNRRLGTLESDVATLKSDVGTLKGSDYERMCREYAPAILGRVSGGMRNLRIVRREELADTLDDAVDSGRITQKERDGVLQADIVLRAKSKDTGEDTYLVVEASVSLASNDLSRAKDRAASLGAALSMRSLPVVVTANPSPDAQLDTTGAEVVIYQGAGSTES